MFQTHDFHLEAVPVAAGQVFEPGDIVVSLDGLAFPGSLAIPGGIQLFSFRGVATKSMDNTDGADGQLLANDAERVVMVDASFDGVYSFLVEGGVPAKSGVLAVVGSTSRTVRAELLLGQVLHAGYFVKPNPDGSGEWMVRIGTALDPK